MRPAVLLRYSGGCACGAVRYETVSAPVFQNHCQCRTCQRRSGTGHGSYLTFGRRAEVTVSNAQRIVLPQTAVLTDEKGSYVLVVNSQNKIERHTVHVAGMVDNGVTIADGVGASDRVVATAGAFLQVGETVKPVSSAASVS